MHICVRSLLCVPVSVCTRFDVFVRVSLAQRSGGCGCVWGGGEGGGGGRGVPRVPVLLYSEGAARGGGCGMNIRSRTISETFGGTNKNTITSLQFGHLHLRRRSICSQFRFMYITHVPFHVLYHLHPHSFVCSYIVEMVASYL